MSKSAFGISVRVWIALLAIIFIAGGERARVARPAFGNLQLSADTSAFVSMAGNLRHGLGLVDNAQIAEYERSPQTYRIHATQNPEVLRYWHVNDVGTALLYAVSALLFGNGPYPPNNLLFLQLIVDTLNVLLIFYLGKRILNDALGLAAALVYATITPQLTMASFVYYYYWQGAFALWNLVFLDRLLDEGLPELPWRRRLLLGGAWGLFIGVTVLIRSLCLGLFLAAIPFIVLRWRRNWRLAGTLIGLGVAGIALMNMMVLVPRMFHYGEISNPRVFWHSIYTGLGAHPNPWGITFDDGVGFKAAEKAGITSADPKFMIHYEDFIKREVFRYYGERPEIFVRNFLTNVVDGMAMRLYNRKDQPVTNRVRMDFKVFHRHVLIAMPLEPQFWPLFVIQLVVFVAVLPTRRWTYFFVLWQGIAMVCFVSALLPPYEAYNSGWFASLSVLLSCMAYGGLLGFALVGRWMADYMLPRKFREPA